VPASKLQFDGKFLLRPAVALAQLDDLPTDQIQLLHFQRGKSFSRGSINLLQTLHKMPPTFLPQT
jgi:hypothetical protein